MRKNLSLSLITIALLSLIFWAIDNYLTPLLRIDFNQNLLLYISITLATLSGISGFKDLLDLIEKIRGKESINIDEKNKIKTSVSKIPDKSYQNFYGRENDIFSILSKLRSPLELPIIGIDGIGGIGKTALAHKIIDIISTEGLFDQIVWERPDNFNSRYQEKNNNEMALSELIDSVARKLGLIEAPNIGISEKFNRLERKFKKDKILIIFDNLETSEVDQELIIGKFFPTLGNSKAILTSRFRFPDSIFSVHLLGLSPSEAIQLMKNEAFSKGNHGLENAEDDDLKQIAIATGGSPQAIKLVLGQLRVLPISIVLKKLKKINLSDQFFNEDDYLNFYRSIYFPSWRLLSESSKILLVSMSNFVPGVGGSFDALKQVSQLTDEEVIKSLRELWLFSLIEVDKTSEFTSEKYFLHTLTQNFIQSDIINHIK